MPSATTAHIRCEAMFWHSNLRKERSSLDIICVHLRPSAVRSCPDLNLLLPRSGTTEWRGFLPAAVPPRRTAFIRSILLTTEVTEGHRGRQVIQRKGTARIQSLTVLSQSLLRPGRSLCACPVSAVSRRLSGTPPRRDERRVSLRGLCGKKRKRASTIQSAG
jgi:hypothetical protein